MRSGGSATRRPSCWRGAVIDTHRDPSASHYLVAFVSLFIINKKPRPSIKRMRTLIPLSLGNWETNFWYIVKRERVTESRDEIRLRNIKSRDKRTRSEPPCAYSIVGIKQLPEACLRNHNLATLEFHSIVSAFTSRSTINTNECRKYNWCRATWPHSHICHRIKSE